MDLYHIKDFSHGFRTPTTSLGSYFMTAVVGRGVEHLDWEGFESIFKFLNEGFSVGLKPGITGNRLGGWYQYSKRFQTLRNDLKARNEKQFGLVRPIYEAAGKTKDCLLIMTPMHHLFTGGPDDQGIVEASIARWIHDRSGLSINVMHS
jgi:hypothetical protein